MQRRRLTATLARLIIYLFALIGFFFTVVGVGMYFGIFNVRGTIAERNAFFMPTPEGATLTAAATPPSCTKTNPCAWDKTPEWAVVRAGLVKDKAIISRVARETGVSERMIASVVVPEQLRFFTSEREVFKRYFEPLKILGSLSQFSLGVSGIKEETARTIEQNAQDPSSPFYPGAGMETLLAYENGVDQEELRFARLTDAKDHYYSYLYTALAIKEITAQWKNAGHDITDEPGVVGTLFNIGFEHSHPKPDPKVGGAMITVGGNIFSFGELGAYFFFSEELRDEFPR
jgi:hypothetical protein